MTAAAPLIIDERARRRLADLRARAMASPLDVLQIMRDVKTPAGKAHHLAKMEKQTVRIDGPWPFFVTFSVETGHRAGTCRHMSMSVFRKGRVPSPEAVWMVAAEMGFVGSLEACDGVWTENLSDGGVAVNIVQAVDRTGARGTA